MPFGLPVVNPKNDYFFNLKKIKSSFIFSSEQFTKNTFPIEIIVSDKNHNFLFTKNISIQEFAISGSIFLINSFNIKTDL